MSYLVFARKYRPQTFEEVVQQDHVTRTLTNAIEAGRVAHAILFAGPRGTGKTTVARVLAKAMNCAQGPTRTPCNTCRSCREITAGNAADVFEIDGASNNSVDQVRELRDNLQYMPAYSRFKIYIIDEVHMLSLAAFNALLKTLEEPPEHILFMFATTELHKIPITILSRCQRHDLRRIDAEAIAGHLALICSQEAVDVDEASLNLIAQEAGGSMRDALSLLDHVLSCTQGAVTVELISDLLGIVDRDHLFELSHEVLNRNLSAVLQGIDAVWRKGYEVKRFFSDLITHFHHLTLVGMGGGAAELVDLPGHEIRRMQEQIKGHDPAQITHIFDALFQAEPMVKLSSQPRFALEMVFLKLFQVPPVLTVDTLIDKLDQLRHSIGQGQPVETDPQPADVQEPEAKKSIEPIPEAEHPVQETAAPAAPRTLDDKTLWDRLTERAAREKPSLAGILKKCRPGGIEGQRLNLEVGGTEFTLK
ncbi:MAG: DNA polymerase III subunit gamma/tau, partial [Desulfosarcinaceae bacterium]